MVDNKQIDDEMKKILGEVLLNPEPEPVKTTNVNVVKAKTPNVVKPIENPVKQADVKIGEFKPNTVTVTVPVAKKSIEQKPIIEKPMEFIKFNSDPISPLIIKEISDFNPHCEMITFSTLFAISHWKSIINISPCGQGKSRSTIELLDLLGIDYSVLSGHITPKKFFQELRKDGILIIDEGALILGNRDIQDLLLSAFQNKEVKWETDRTSLSHHFKGIILCNANQINGNSDIQKAVMDRCIVNRLKLSSKDINEKIKSKIDYEPNFDVWYVIMENLGLLDCSKQKKFYNLDPITTNVVVSCRLSCRLPQKAINLKTNLFKTLIEKSDKTKNITEKDIKKELCKRLERLHSLESMRAFEKLELIASFSYALFKDFSLVDVFLPLMNSDAVYTIASLSIPNAEKVKMIAAEEECSIRTAQRHLKQQLKKIEGEGL